MTGGRFTRPPVVCALVALAIAGALIACGDDEVPEGALAFVDGVKDGEVTQAEVDEAIGHAAETEGISEAPAEGTPEYEALLVPAVSEVIVIRWIHGEGAEAGVSTAETEEHAGEHGSLLADFPAEFIAKWRERTVCSEELLTAAEDESAAREQLAELCSNFN